MFLFKKNTPLTMRNCIENMRKLEQNPIHISRKKSNGFGLNPFGGISLRLKEGAKKCRLGQP
jgi:hypothetical protein